MFQLSILLPSKYPDKLHTFLNNLQETVDDLSKIEIVICRDGNEPTYRKGNFVYCYSPPSKYRSTFHEKPWLESTGRWLLMANDDMIFKTKNWDKLIPYDKYPDDLVMFYFQDKVFNENFACHPVFSRKMMNLAPGILSPLYQITKCDNTIWDCHPPHRRVYLSNIEIEHFHEPFGPEWKPVYEEDNAEYMKHVEFRARIRNKIMESISVRQPKVMLGIVTGEFARRADFYDHLQMIEKPKDSIVAIIHGQSIANNRNKVVEQALIHNCTHVLFLDDDVIPKSNIIYQLLKHDVDICLALQLRRNFPHQPLIFDKELTANKFRIYQLQNGVQGLVPIVGGGLGSVLIKTEVFESMVAPWFRFGEFDLDQMNEDTGFYKRAREYGFKVFCDLDCSVGHIISAVVRPYYINGNWTANYDTNGTGSFGFAFAQTEEKVGV